LGHLKIDEGEKDEKRENWQNNSFLRNLKIGKDFQSWAFMTGQN
jgi:hypothetical protein